MERMRFASGRLRRAEYSSLFQFIMLDIHIKVPPPFLPTTSQSFPFYKRFLMHMCVDFRASGTSISLPPSQTLILIDNILYMFFIIWSSNFEVSLNHYKAKAQHSLALSCSLNFKCVFVPRKQKISWREIFTISILIWLIYINLAMRNESKWRGERLQNNWQNKNKFQLKHGNAVLWRAWNEIDKWMKCTNSISYVTRERAKGKHGPHRREIKLSCGISGRKKKCEASPKRRSTSLNMMHSKTLKLSCDTLSLSACA